MPKTWIVRQRDVTLLLLCMLLSSDGLKMSNFVIGQILKAFLALFVYFFCRRKFSSMEAPRHYWKLKNQNKRHWNSVWDDQSIPFLAIDDVCGQPGAVWVGWGSFSQASSSRGCSASTPLYPAQRGPEGPLGNRKYPNTKCLWAFYSGVSCHEGQHSFTEPGRALQPDPSPAITAARRGLGWVVITCTAAGQGGWPLQAGTKKRWKEVKSAISLPV